MSLKEDFKKIRQRTEDLCAPLTIEDYVPQPIYYASPPKWHLAHTTWFFEEMILKHQLEGYKEFDPDFGFLFNSYYNTIGKRTLRAERGNITRPGVERVYEYREHVDHGMQELLEKGVQKDVADLIRLGLNHEQQHQELLMTDLKYTLGHNPTFPIYRRGWEWLSEKNENSGFHRMETGIYEIGHEGDGFFFDNEQGRHQVFLHEFDISKNLVTCGEYMEFMADGGYQDHRLWLDEGWTWLNHKGIHSPMYWHEMNGVWHVYTFAGLVPVHPDTILSHVSFYEAQAFANWKGMRLPTEFEWEASSDHLPWGLRWEWTQSAYLPYPGYSVAEGAVGEYNGKFMVNQMVLRGASVATAPGHSRKTYRNFFHPQFQWQYSGIRLVK